MGTVIKGKDAILYFKVDGYYRPVCCMEAWSLTTNAETSETSTTQTGTDRTFRYNRKTWTINCNGLCSFDSNHSLVKMRLIQQAFFTPLPISIVETDDNGIGSTFKGDVLLTSITNSSAANDFESYTLDALGNGAYTITDIPTDPNECCQDDWIYYTANGTEGYTVTIPQLLGRRISGRIYRDGIEYRPSGYNNDGTGAPVGKQFKFEPLIPRISFDSTLPRLASGEPVDIPFNLCGGQSLTCDIEITNVIPSVVDGNFNINFDPVVNNVTTIPDSVTVRYSTDNGTTWHIPSYTYDPLTNYNLVVINDVLDTTDSYLFEITPVCVNESGTPGTGYYYPCIDAAFTETPDLPNATVGAPYIYSVPITGSAPFEIINVTKPSWLGLSILYSGSTYLLYFLGTPTAEATGLNVSFDITNCTDASLHWEGTLDVVASVNNINWDYANTVGVGGTFKILVNGTTAVNRTVNSSGSFSAAIGDEVSIVVQSKLDGFGTIGIFGPYTHNSSEAHINSDSFTVAAGTYYISGISE